MADAPTDKPKRKPEILARRSVARSRLFHVEEVDLRFSNGVETCYERLVGSSRGAVIVVPMQSDGTVLLIREYAAGTDRYELGLPKGLVEHGEDLLAAANREIMEEIGFGANQSEILGALTVAPGYMSHTTHVILAQDLYAKRVPGDEPETIEVVPWPLQNLSELLQCEDCTEARSIAALFMAREKLLGK